MARWPAAGSVRPPGSKGWRASPPRAWVTGDGADEAPADKGDVAGEGEGDAPGEAGPGGGEAEMAVGVAADVQVVRGGGQGGEGGSGELGGRDLAGKEEVEEEEEEE